jgi:alpha-tubulin suppressor-like RCC1 family protein
MKEPKTVHLNIDDMNSAQSISSGSHHSALVTKAGEILMCGSTLHGKLGIPDMQATNINKF